MMKAVNLDTYNLALLTAKEDVLNPRSSINWALFRYDGFCNNLKLSDSGVGGLAELRGKFHANRALYGLCHAAGEVSEQSCVVLIAWVGEGVDEFRRAEYASHLPAIRAFFKEAHLFVNAKSLEDVTDKRISSMITTVGASAMHGKSVSRFLDKAESVGTNYRRTVPAVEIKKIHRDSFWARSEREEEERKAEERRRAMEERRRLEKERILQERREAEERERKMWEKERLVQEQRRIQAEQEAEVERQELLRWEQQKKQQEEEMHTAFLQSRSFSQAAEAAALVSRRSTNPREFFRQLSLASAHEPVSPGSPRSGKPPFRWYHRSLTDTAFIFRTLDVPNSSRTQSPTMDSPLVTSPASMTYRPVGAGSQDIHDPAYSKPSVPAPNPPLPAPSPQSDQPAPVDNTSAPETPSLTPDVTPSIVPTTPHPQTPHCSLTLMLPPDHIYSETHVALMAEDTATASLQEAQHPQEMVGASITSHLDKMDIESDVKAHVPETDTDITPQTEKQDSGESEGSCSVENTLMVPEGSRDRADCFTEEDINTLDEVPSSPELGVDVSVMEEIDPVMHSMTTVEADLNEGIASDKDAIEAGEQAPGQASVGTGALGMVGQAEEEETHEALAQSLSNPSAAPGSVNQWNIEVAPILMSASEVTDDQDLEHLNALYGHHGSDQSFISTEEDQIFDLICPNTRHNGTEEDVLLHKQEETKTYNWNEQDPDMDEWPSQYDYKTGDESDFAQELLLDPAGVVGSVNEMRQRGRAKMTASEPPPPPVI